MMLNGVADKRESTSVKAQSPQKLSRYKMSRDMHTTVVAKLLE